MLAESFGSVTTVWVWDPRHVCTAVMGLGCAMSEMSKIRMPRMRSLLTESCIPWVPQSSRPLKSSPETNSRLRYTETSFCASGHTYAVTSVGWPGCAMSHTCRPWKLPRSEEHTSELQSQFHIVCRLLLAKKNGSFM